MKNKILALTVLSSLVFALNLNAEKDAREHHGHHPGMKMMDKNNDGQISKEEWMGHFNEIDADKNGNITKEEMKQHHEKMDGKKHDHKHDHDMHKK